MGKNTKDNQVAAEPVLGGIPFFNIHSKETRVCQTEEHIAAFYNSSDLGPNAKNRQDRGWRLDPEIVIEMEEIQADESRMAEIAKQFSIPEENVEPYHILKVIAARILKENKAKLPKEEGAYASEYERMVTEARQKRLDKASDTKDNETTN